MAGILLFSDEIEKMNWLLGKAEELHGWWTGAVTVVAMTPEVVSAAKAGSFSRGVDRVRVWEGTELDGAGIAQGLARVCGEHAPDLVLVSTGKRYRDVAGRLATRLRTGCIPDCSSVRKNEDGCVVAERLAYGGNATASVVSKTRPAIVTMLPVEDLVAPAGKGHAEIVAIEGMLPSPRVKRIGASPVETDTDLPSAERIVAVGRGFAREEDLKIAEELASALKAELGCSRPLAEDLGWLPLNRQVGLTGVQVRPRLYVAVGISGQIQHLVGIKDAHIIVAINRDRGAPIFRVADYGVVGDLYAVLPALVDALRPKGTK